MEKQRQEKSRSDMEKAQAWLHAESEPSVFAIIHSVVSIVLLVVVVTATAMPLPLLLPLPLPPPLSTLLLLLLLLVLVLVQSTRLSQATICKPR